MHFKPRNIVDIRFASPCSPPLTRAHIVVSAVRLLCSRAAVASLLWQICCQHGMSCSSTIESPAALSHHLCRASPR